MQIARGRNGGSPVRAADGNLRLVYVTTRPLSLSRATEVLALLFPEGPRKRRE